MFITNYIGYFLQKLRWLIKIYNFPFAILKYYQKIALTFVSYMFIIVNYAEVIT